MKKTILIIVAVILGLSIAVKAGLFNALLMLFLLGVVPGTDIVIPANVMLLMISAATSALLFFSTARTLLRTVLVRRGAEQKSPASSRLPKQRFKKIEA